ncbi:hypothetical protein CSB85_1872 [Pseudomonas aeruginosa]|nr:hypothetical protein CSB85_1872 [Pseudomonas aeruginosa]AWE81483.1 hypothetical protein CSC31_1970 [Pseudomonas aeruginosa]
MGWGDDLHLFDPRVFRLAFDNTCQIMRVLEQQCAGDHLTPIPPSDLQVEPRPLNVLFDSCPQLSWGVL